MIAQAVMAIVLIVAGQWLFAMMIGSGMLGMAIPLISRVMRDRASRRTEAARTETDPPPNNATAVNALDSPHLEALLNLDADDDPLLWRDLIRHWLGPRTLAVPIAVSRHGPFTLDLHRQGPHAVVAGTTGSGKSVLLQSWCMALATLNPPDRVRFVFLDFKGGSTFQPLAALPHVVGNVCDLNLAHAARALLALECELTRRERRLVDEEVSHIDGLREAEPELIVVIDEFHALKDQLPDYIGRLIRVASLGRSLGMHIIACTQNPIGQINADMKANMSLKLCLRVLDAMQSHEMLGDACAGLLSPQTPGAAFCSDGEGMTGIRCCAIRDPTPLLRAVALAHRFMDLPTVEPLFTAPLPTSITRDAAFERTGADDRTRAAGREGTPAGAERRDPSNTTEPEGRRPMPSPPFALGDDGVTWFLATLPTHHGNVAIIGPHGRGKSTLLHRLDAELRRYGIVPDWPMRESPPVDSDQPRHDAPAVFGNLPHHDDRENHPDTPGNRAPDTRRIWLVDDADELLDPLSAQPRAHALQEALRKPGITVIFAARTSRHVRIPDHCSTRVVFTTGDRATDLSDGIPSSLLGTLGTEGHRTPGRAVFLHEGASHAIQCFS